LIDLGIADRLAQNQMISRRHLVADPDRQRANGVAVDFVLAAFAQGHQILKGLLNWSHASESLLKPEKQIVGQPLRRPVEPPRNSADRHDIHDCHQKGSLQADASAALRFVQHVSSAFILAHCS
jgi:hypothetical protein